MGGVTVGKAAKEGDIIPMSKRVGLSTETPAMTTERARRNDTADSGIDAPATKNGAGNSKGNSKSKGRGSTETKSSASGGETPAMFTPGGPGGPGRPKAVDNRAYIDAIKAGFPPERIVELLGIAIQIAIDTNSWRGIEAAARFAADYGLGKPVKRVESTGDTSLAELLAGVDTSKPLLNTRYNEHSIGSDVAGSGGSGDVVAGENNGESVEVDGE
jgi:hypothetical protein